MNKPVTPPSLSAASGADASLVTTDVASSNVLSGAESARIKASLHANGVAVIRGFIDSERLRQLREDVVAAVSDDFDFGVPYGFELPAKRTPGTSEFFHPFLFSSAAAALVTSPSLQEIIEDYLGSAAIIHHALFQRSLPVDQPTVDWHVDTGSNKALNGASRFPDRRLRMITYLSDVKSGGLGYILDTRDATKLFLSRPVGELFPLSEVPADPRRRIVIEEPMGTIIFFDAHGLHRPEPPKEDRLVLNTWFARNDFSAKLPPVLVSVAGVPKENYGSMHVFGNARGIALNNLKRRPVAKKGLFSSLKGLLR